MAHHVEGRPFLRCQLAVAVVVEHRRVLGDSSVSHCSRALDDLHGAAEELVPAVTQFDEVALVALPEFQLPVHGDSELLEIEGNQVFARLLGIVS